MTRRCFILMPIRSPGSDDHTHFRALYEDFLKPPLVELGYDVSRADDTHVSGAISRNIILQIAESTLVVADLTDLNPNVFYELGVRHCLRGQGTIMILDERRTDLIPFDLTVYRVIKFTSDLSGLGKLRRELQAFASNLESVDSEYRDNPVHEMIPSLPIDAFSSSKGTTEGELRDKLAKALRELRNYEATYGRPPVGDEALGGTPLSVVLSTLAEAKEGLLPRDLVRKAKAAGEREDAVEFLNLVLRLLERPTVPLEPEQYVDLAGVADVMGLDDVEAAIYEHARAKHPTDATLRSAELANLAHSHDPAARARARKELLDDAGIRVTDTDVTLPEQLSERAAARLGLALDAYHGDELHQEALRVASAAYKKFSNDCVTSRNYARALRTLGRDAEAMQQAQRAATMPGSDDVCAAWFGTDLFNKNRHADAFEAYLVACIRDPTDATNFALAANACAWGVGDRITPRYEGERRLPDTVEEPVVEDLIRAAMSCERFDQDDLRRCRSAAREADMERSIEDLLAERQSGAGEWLSRARRVQLAVKLHDVVRTDLTSIDDPPVSS